jgi:hypothetical protein
MSQSYIIIFVEIERHVTGGSPFIFSCLSDFEMLFLVIHEQTKLVIVHVITYDRNKVLHLSLQRYTPIPNVPYYHLI